MIMVRVSPFCHFVSFYRKMGLTADTDSDEVLCVGIWSLDAYLACCGWKSMNVMDIRIL